MLLLLYLFLDYVKSIFTVLICFSCVGCVSIIIEDFLLQGLKAGEESRLKKTYNVRLLGEVTVAGMIGGGIGFVLAVSWYFTHYWLLNNILAFFLALTFLKTLRLSKLAPGMLLLGLLFFYDIFWVFLSPYFTTGGKSVMVAVATGLDIPIKLVMPHITLTDYPTTACSLLGLGDILIPGIFIIFMARFGFEMIGSSVYYKGALIAYTISLLLCYMSLWIFKAA
jgi:signal peptide peptidase-like 2B